MSSVIRTSGLTKHYGRVHALDGLDLEVEPGQVHGFLGPNGAGKSTTIRILLGLGRATGGEVTVAGAHTRSEERLTPGQAAVVTPDEARLVISGEGEVYVAQPGARHADGAS